MSGRGIDDVVAADVVVVGGGAAGLSVALGLPTSLQVLLIASAPLGAGGATPWARGGVAVAADDGDTPAGHARDTHAVGGGLTDPDAVMALTDAGPEVLRRLVDLGVRFDRDAAGGLLRNREAGHSHRRVVRARGDRTGAELQRALTREVASRPNVRVAEATTAVRLLMAGERVAGVLGRQAGGRLVAFRAPAVVLATGGIGRLYRPTTNPAQATGDGLALAARAGAAVRDVEFVQFHPTALDVGADPAPLLSEALRGDGAELVDGGGRPLLEGVHPDGSLAPRDVVAAALWSHARSGRRALLDARAIFRADPERYPGAAAACRVYGLDPAADLLPVTAAAHYHMGGIAVDRYGRATIPGLWACGEVAATGVHGANRLASNSLLEALAFGAEVAADVADHAGGVVPEPLTPLPTALPGGDGQAMTATVRALMSAHVGVVRDAEGLATAVTRLAAVEATAGPDGAAARMALVGRMVAMAALARRETRGAHRRADHPGTDPAQARRQVLMLAPDGAISVMGEPERAGYYEGEAS